VGTLRRVKSKNYSYYNSLQSHAIFIVHLACRDQKWPMVKKRPEKKAPVTSRKPLAGEALYQKLIEDEFLSITLNGTTMTAEDWKPVNKLEEETLHTLVVAIPAMHNEPDMVKESTLLGARVKLADIYHRAGLEANHVDGLKRVDEFMKRTQAAIERINGKNIDKSLH